MTDAARDLAREAVRRGAVQKVPELERLVALVRERRPRTVVEIGTDKGGTLFAWCRLADPEAVLVSIDLPGGLFGGGYSWRGARRFRHFFAPPGPTNHPRRPGRAPRPFRHSSPQPGQPIPPIRRDSHDPKTVRRLERLLSGRPVDFL